MIGGRTEIHIWTTSFTTHLAPCALIDFEVVHDQSLPAMVRHADDLLVFSARPGVPGSSDQWLPFALCFNNAYDNRMSSRTNEIAFCSRRPSGLVVSFGLKISSVRI